MSYNLIGPNGERADWADYQRELISLEQRVKRRIETFFPEEQAQQIMGHHELPAAATPVIATAVKNSQPSPSLDQPAEAAEPASHKTPANDEEGRPDSFTLPEPEPAWIPLTTRQKRILHLHAGYSRSESKLKLDIEILRSARDICHDFAQDNGLINLAAIDGEIQRKEEELEMIQSLMVGLEVLKSEVEKDAREQAKKGWNEQKVDRWFEGGGRHVILPVVAERQATAEEEERSQD